MALTLMQVLRASHHLEQEHLFMWNSKVSGFEDVQVHFNEGSTLLFTPPFKIKPKGMTFKSQFLIFSKEAGRYPTFDEVDIFKWTQVWED